MIGVNLDGNKEIIGICIWENESSKYWLSLLNEIKNRDSLKFVSWKDMKKVANDLRSIYTAKTEDTAPLALKEFKNNWDKQYPNISLS